VVNAITGNANAPLVKDNDYYFHDWSGGRRARTASPRRK
jgi:hypothetical protein